MSDDAIGCLGTIGLIIVLYILWVNGIVFSSPLGVL